jgi:hypothetical protein
MEVLLGIVMMASFSPKQIAQALMMPQAAAQDSEIERLRRNGPPEPSSRLPDPPGLAELKSLYASGGITQEQFNEQAMRLLPENPYPNEPTLPRRKSK